MSITKSPQDIGKDCIPEKAKISLSLHILNLHLELHPGKMPCKPKHELGCQHN